MEHTVQPFTDDAERIEYLKQHGRVIDVSADRFTLEAIHQLLNGPHETTMVVKGDKFIVPSSMDDMPNPGDDVTYYAADIDTTYFLLAKEPHSRINKDKQFLQY